MLENRIYQLLCLGLTKENRPTISVAGPMIAPQLSAVGEVQGRRLPAHPECLKCTFSQLDALGELRARRRDTQAIDEDRERGLGSSPATASERQPCTASVLSVAPNMKWLGGTARRQAARAPPRCAVGERPTTPTSPTASPWHHHTIRGGRRVHDCSPCTPLVAKRWSKVVHEFWN